MNKTNSILLVFCFLNLSLFAFRPVAHVILKDQIVKGLPEENRFRIAMEKYPQIAAWGAVGPDLGYNIDFSRTFRSRWKRQIKNSWQLADLAHYHKVGTFVNSLIEEAYAQNDDKLFAFIGGWMTHIAGDFGAHNEYVKEEAGYYIAFEGGRDVHSDLEKISDAYLYMQYAHNYCLSGWDFKPEYYWEEFFGVKAVPKNKSERIQNKDKLKIMLEGVERAFVKIYIKTYEVDTVSFNLAELASTYYRSVGEGLGAYGGFKQYTVMEATDKSLLKDRQKRIDTAFNTALRYGKEFLNMAVTTNRIYSDAWNLDIGENGEPTYIIRIDADKKMIARTKNDLYISFKQKNGKESPPIKITTKIGPLKFAFYQEDAYFYAVNLGGATGEVDCWKLQNVDSATLAIRPRKRQLFVNTFRVKRATIYYNGKIVSSQGDLNAERSIKLKRTTPVRFILKSQS